MCATRWSPAIEDFYTGDEYEKTVRRRAQRDNAEDGYSLPERNTTRNSNPLYGELSHEMDDAQANGNPNKL